jgi:hypothetical protein
MKGRCTAVTVPRKEENSTIMNAIHSIYQEGQEQRE